ncbi:MAG TPA: response regulator [Thermodesulfobacteriota bacterium]|nr:response regulator [Thermodesulfobacteriota bacterium]
MPYKILIVDDAAFMRNMIKDVFESMPGFSVIGEASNGIEAVEKYKALHPDLVTMDIVMPLKSGIEATKEITSVDREAKIIMCSALGQESLVMEAVEAGARDFIVKPFKAEKVQEVVNRVLGIKA